MLCHESEVKMYDKVQPDMSTRPNKTLEGIVTNLNLPIVHEWIRARKSRLGDLLLHGP